ncbi:MAG: bifunctional diaminohydroxyphosphoribosylaminopyrimidine deaminase/5-amino-6-(5-phosphoribosylamino)uracil reductase RibD, partial [Pseudomonadota bacterium]|nr:bifunctional diaminohydroxyphosphoribosylaminopyrimidine deaminase/5-amino-6-(5-phosphoribosylamino)uracil reductase RibD [Pseudomonadota bacterium]
MQIALRLAGRGLGRTWPNPSVGAVIVRESPDPEVVARGWTMPGGRPHAEAVALEKAGAAARGATLYVTLEPCSHLGRSTPCTEAIIAAGIGRVVCSTGDPDPRVSGSGFARLETAGITLKQNLLAKEGRQLVLGHVLRVTENRPMVSLKLAVGSDGLVPRGDGRPKWVTGDAARAAAHLLRARSDAI